jgi:hypothetical protein
MLVDLLGDFSSIPNLIRIACAVRICCSPKPVPMDACRLPVMNSPGSSMTSCLFQIIFCSLQFAFNKQYTK